MKRLLVLLACLLLAACRYSPQDWRVEPLNPDPLERTLWEVCLDRETGSWNVPSDRPPHTPRCTAPTAVKYPTPIRVGYSGKNLAHAATVRLAVSQWNAWLEWPGFMVWDSKAPHITVEFGDHPAYLGLAQLAYDRGWTCTANVYTGGTEQGKVALHEIGHCLGLAHDGNLAVPDDYEVRCSVMKQGLRCVDYGLTDADKIALWELYDE